MESIFVRYRNLLVLFATLLAQILILASQVHRGESGRMSVDPRDSSSVRLIRLWANALVTPPERLIHSTGLGTVNVWQNYIDLRHVRQQNKDLQTTVDRLRLEQASLLEDARQGQRLQALMKFQEKYIYATLPAQVLGTSGTVTTLAGVALDLPRYQRLLVDGVMLSRTEAEAANGAAGGSTEEAGEPVAEEAEQA